MKVLVAFLLCASVPTARAALSLECGLLDQLAPIPFGEGPYDPEVGKPDRIRTTKDSDAYIIATSPETIDTTIVRYVPKDPAKPSTITKVYSDIYKFAIEAAGYRLLETLYEGESKAGAFSVMKISFASVPNFVFMPDVRGRGLVRVLADPRVDRQIRTALLEAYKSALKDFDERISRKEVTVRSAENDANGYPKITYAVTQNNRNVQLSIRADQVVVTFEPGDPSKFRLTLIDPH